MLTLHVCYSTPHVNYTALHTVHFIALHVNCTAVHYTYYTGTRPTMQEHVGIQANQAELSSTRYFDVARSYILIRRNFKKTVTLLWGLSDSVAAKLTSDSSIH